MRPETDQLFPSDAPRRAHQIICTVEADTAERLADELRHMADCLDRGQLTTGCSGGYSGGSLYTYTVLPNTTHDSYFQAITAWLEARKA